ncbi:MAG: winged helix DNA-binding protein [Nocardioidaceae bacterium]
MTKWLTKNELASWLELAGVMLRLNPALDSQLVRDSDLTHFGYLCLAMLSERDDRTLMMSTLAARTNASLSRLSHVVTKLEARGYVERKPCEHSRRITMVRLTDEGYAALVAAAPGHVENVRALVYDGLSTEDVEALRRIMRHIRLRLEGVDSVCDRPA